MSKKVAILIGPSGAGKTSIGKKLKKLGYQELVSVTTRAMREKEENGVNYYFVDSVSVFDSLDFLEESEYNGNKYGLLRKEFELKSSLSDKLFVVMEIKGAREFRKLMKQIGVKTVFFFIAPINSVHYFTATGGSFDDRVVRERLELRGDPKDKIDSRINLSRELFESDKEECDYVVLNESKSDHEIDMSLNFKASKIDQVLSEE